MLKVRIFLVVCAHLIVAAVAVAQNSYVFQLPGSSGTAVELLGKGDDDFSRSLTAATPAKAYGVIANPTASRFYILTPAGVYAATATSGGGVFANPTLGTPTLLGGALAGAPNAAQITPDGKYLLLITSHLYIVDTATNAVAAGADIDVGVPAGQLPVSIAVSHDGKTAWVLSNGHSQSTVTTVSLANFQSTTQLTLASAGSSITLSPKNLLYVAAFGPTVYELTSSPLAITEGGTITISGTPGPPQFTSDGNTAYFLNTAICSTCAPILKLDVPSHTTFSWLPPDGSAPPLIDQILVAGTDRAFAFSATSTKLWTITPTPLSLTQSIFSGVGTGDVRTAAISNERPNARYLYLSNSATDMFRVNLTTNQVDRTSQLDPFQYKILTFVPIPARTGGTTLNRINPTQPVTAASNTILIGQILDAVGHPVFGAPVTFSTKVTNSCAGAVIATPSVTSTAEGFVQTLVTAPSVTGSCTVTMTSGSLSTDFQLLIGAGSGGPSGSPQISIYTGDGEMLRQNQSTLETRQPLTVRITDANGKPIQGVTVGFAVKGTDAGSVNSPSVTTDSDGKAATDFTSGQTEGFPYVLSRVTATSVYGTVEFYVVTQDAKINDLHAPISLMVAPTNQALTIAEGGFIPNALSAQMISAKTAGPIPNVGLRLADFSNPILKSSVVSCVGLSRGDANGISRCDVQAACQPTITLPAAFSALLEVGEYQYFEIRITVTKAAASLISAAVPTDQSGNPGDIFTLRATVTDTCQHAAPNFNGLTWSVLPGSPGSASISSAQTSSDFLGQATANVTLGQTAGLARIQLTGPGLSPIIFNLTTKTSISGISLVSGDKQSAVIGQPFANPVVFVVRDGNNNPTPGLVVNFTATNGAALNPASATTNAQGLVQTVVTAGSATGNIVVTGKTGTVTATASLTANLKGATLTSSSFTNAASGWTGITPCGLVTVSGDGLAPTVQGVVSAATFFGGMPYTLAGLSITANGIPAPIQSVSNVNGGQSAIFQAPCELTAGFATMGITVNGVLTTVNNVLVVDLQPGLFTSSANNKQYATVIRKVDGTYVTPSNPARRGEVCYVIVTGLGQTTAPLVTNSIGVGTQNTNRTMGVFLSGVPLPAISARYLFGSVGSYLVEFKIPTDAPTGPDQDILVVGDYDKDAFIVGNTGQMAGVIAVP